MLDGIVRWSLERPRLIAWACVGFLVFGAIEARRTRFELLPQLAPAQTTIHTEAPGLVAEQVETLVTHPIEAAILGAAGVRRVRSESVQGLSIVMVDFTGGLDPGPAREAISERLATVAGALPSGVGAPRLAPLTAVGGRVLRLGFTSAKLDGMALRDEIDWTVRPRLLAAAGVGRVAVYGGETRRIEVRARPGDLSDSDLGFLDILNAVRRATSVAGAGFIDTETQRVLIEPHGQGLTKADIGAGQIQTAGSAPVRIEDVSDVVEAAAPAYGDALIMGRPGVLVDVAKQYGADTLATTHAVEDALARLRPSLAARGVKVWSDLDRPASYAGGILRGLAADLAIGAGLAAIALAIFLRSSRATAISLLAAPLSLLAAALAFDAFGWSWNAMTIGGLALGLGVVIDDAIIDVENVMDELRLAEARHASRARAILAASVEVRAPVIYATSAMIVALLPVLALKGAVGSLLSPLAGATILACLASLVVATMVTPALALLLLRRVGPATRVNALHGLHERHGDALAGIGRLGWAPVLGAAALAIIAALVIASAHPQGLPTPDDGQSRVAIAEPVGSSLAVSRDYGERIAALLTPVAGVRSISERIGRDPEGDDSWGPERGVVELGLTPSASGAPRRGVAAEVSRRLQSLPGLHPVVADLVIGSNDELGGPQAVRFKVLGEDLDLIDAATVRVAGALRRLPGAGTVLGETSVVTPVVRADLNFQRLALYGLSAADALDTVQAAFAGERVGRIYVGDRVVDLAVSAAQSLRQDPEGVGDLLLRSTSGISVPLKAVANVYLDDDRASIGHEGGFRVRQVAAEPRDPRRFIAAARRAIARLDLPPGVFVQIDSGFQAARDARNTLILHYVLALLAVFALLSIAFDGRTAALILGSSVFSLIGAAVAVACLGQVLSLGALFGMIALFGLSLRSAILVFGDLEGAVLSRHAPWLFDTVIAATKARTTPILMTSLLVALALAPLAIHAGGAGREILGPMAVVIEAGLLTGAIGTLLVLPSAIFKLWRPAFARRARRHG